MKAENEKTLIHCLLIALAIFIPYHQVAQHRFIEFDDGIYAFMNIYIIQGLTWESLVWAFTNIDSANWHPLTWISHLVDRELFGPSPGGYLLMNVAWHTVTACLCYIAFFKCTQRRFFALTVALIFALHPANVENVAWASERKSLVEAFFWFLGMIAYLEYLETRKLKFYGILIIAHCLGLMGKAMQVTFPCAMVLIHLLHRVSTAQRDGMTMRDYWTGICASCKLVWPLLLLSVYFSFVTAAAQNMAMSNLETQSITSRIINVLLSYEKYVRMFFSPGELAPFYPLFFTELQPGKAIYPAIFLAGVTLLLLLVGRKRPIALLGWLWFLGTMVPVIGLVQVGSQSHADRYLYLPMIGLAFIFPELFAALRNLHERKANLIQTGWLVFVTLAFGSATKIQVSYWHDGVTLFRHAISVTGDCLTSVNCLACSYLRQERYPEAVAYIDSKIAVAKNPSNIGKFHSMKAQAYMSTHDYDAAGVSAKEAIAQGRQDAINHWILASVYYHQNKFVESKQELLKAKSLFQAPDPTSLINRNVQNGFQTLGELLKNTPLEEVKATP